MPRLGLVAALVLVLTGLAQPLAGPPVGQHWLSVVLFAPAMSILSRLRGRSAWLGGWLFGAATSAGIFWWLVPTIDRFTALGMPGALAVLGLFSLAFGFFGAVFGWGAHAVREASGSLWPVGLAAWYVACEFLNPQLFPYTHGASWFQVPDVFLLSALTGVTGVTFLQLLLNGLVAAAGERWRADGDASLRAGRALRRSLPLVLAVWLLGVGYAHHRHGVVRDAMADAPTRRFALIQTNTDEERLHAMVKEDRTLPERDLVALTREALEMDPDIDIVVWPEGAIRGSLRTERRRPMRDLAVEHDVEIWSGIVERRGPKGARTRHNGAYRLQPDRSFSAPYDKNILVPFGEYMPLVRFLPFLSSIRSFKALYAGDGPTILQGSKAPPAGFLVCYEATRFRYVRRTVAAGAEILGTVTYDGWFGDTNALDLHMLMAATLSATTGRPHVRAATTGISMATGADGVLIGKGGRAERTWISLDVPLATVPAPYVVLGDWVAWLCIAVGFGLAARGRRPWRDAPAQRDVRRRLQGVALPALFLAAATVAWSIDRGAPAGDLIAWGSAVASLGWLVLGRRGTT